MPFLRANVIPVNPQIHANVMRPLFALNCIFEPLFVHVPDIIHFLKFLLSALVDIVNAELIESTLKQIIMCTYVLMIFYGSRIIKIVACI
jgi:hypothetical protein